MTGWTSPAPGDVWALDLPHGTGPYQFDGRRFRPANDTSPAELDPSSSIILDGHRLWPYDRGVDDAVLEADRRAHHDPLTFERLVTGEGYAAYDLTRPVAAHAERRDSWHRRVRAWLAQRIAPLVPPGHPWAEPSTLDRRDRPGTGDS